MKIIILAGGSGARLWPLSRTHFPKQFLKLKKDRSLFQMTFERSLKLVDIDDIYVVTNVNYKFLVLGQAEELGYRFKEANILVEPVARNTLPAIYYGVKEIQKSGEDIVTIFPSDHLIEIFEEHFDAVLRATFLAGEYLVTYGVLPSGPHTGYGYIKPGGALDKGFKVEAFKEKPDEEKAKAYIKEGYLWNSGIFTFHTGIFTEEVQRCCPEVEEAFRNGGSVDEIFAKVPSLSIDYGLMEKSSRVAVVPADLKWSDLGSFDSFFEEFPCDGQGNVVFNEGVLIDASGNLLYTDDGKIAAMVGVEDLIVVDKRDALLICPRSQAQKVKEVVERLKNAGDARADFHFINYRPWGSYIILEEGFFYKIKRITVMPDKKLSYQMHHHRSEHWIVVRGTAKVTIENTETLVYSGESTFVRSGKKHRLENPGRLLLEVIEVQLGEYLEEDDIIRFDDDFDRI